MSHEYFYSNSNDCYYTNTYKSVPHERLFLFVCQLNVHQQNAIRLLDELVHNHAGKHVEYTQVFEFIHFKGSYLNDFLIFMLDNCASTLYSSNLTTETCRKIAKAKAELEKYRNRNCGNQHLY